MKKTVVSFCVALAVFFLSAVALCIKSLYAPQAVSSMEEKKLKIVLDAGHGGMDGGVVGVVTKQKESDINLAITLLLKETLADMGFDVTLTRKTQEGLYDTATKGFKRRDMQKRKEIIDKVEPTLVVSVHQNFYPSSSTRGGQVFFNAENQESRRLAEAVQKQLNELYGKEGVKERQSKSGQFYMLSCTEYPTVIVECGFLSNKKDDLLLQSDTWKKGLVNSLSMGILDYLSGYTS